MSVNIYQKGQNTQLTQHFTLSEFQCKGKNCGCQQVLHDPALSAYLQQIRDHFGKPVIITSGYRCKQHNTAVGGAAGSLHTTGQAADFYISGVAPETIAAFAESIGVKGIGLYGPEDGNFVHIDTRNYKSFWCGHKQIPRDSFLEPSQHPFMYAVTCRINGEAAVHTLLFDRAVGSHLQILDGYAAAVKMDLNGNETQFSAVTTGKDHLELMHITKISL
jgi:hypothetical protein